MEAVTTRWGAIPKNEGISPGNELHCPGELPASVPAQRTPPPGPTEAAPSQTASRQSQEPLGARGLWERSEKPTIPPASLDLLCWSSPGHTTCSHCILSQIEPLWSKTFTLPRSQTLVREQKQPSNICSLLWSWREVQSPSGSLKRRDADPSPLRTAQHKFCILFPTHFYQLRGQQLHPCSASPSSSPETGVSQKRPESVNC